jgi:hypothetical protein
VFVILAFLGQRQEEHEFEARHGLSQKRKIKKRKKEKEWVFCGGNTKPIEMNRSSRRKALL